MIKYWFEKSDILIEYPDGTTLKDVLEDFSKDEKQEKIFYVSFFENDLEKMF